MKTAAKLTLNVDVNKNSAEDDLFELRLLAENAIQGTFLGLDMDESRSLWTRMQIVMLSADELDNLRSKKSFKEAAFLANQICDSLSNTVLDDFMHSNLMDQNTRQAAVVVCGDVNLGSTDHIEAVEMLKECLARMTPLSSSDLSDFDKVRLSFQLEIFERSLVAIRNGYLKTILRSCVASV